MVAKNATGGVCAYRHVFVDGCRIESNCSRRHYYHRVVSILRYGMVVANASTSMLNGNAEGVVTSASKCGLGMLLP